MVQVHVPMFSGFHGDTFTIGELVFPLSVTDHQSLSVDEIVCCLQGTACLPGV